jgi:hypothetical protein
VSVYQLPVRIRIDSEPDGTAKNFTVMVKGSYHETVSIPVRSLEDAKELASHIVRLRRTKGD